MNVTQPWNIVFLIGFLVFYSIRAVYARAARGQGTAVSRFGGLERFLLDGSIDVEWRGTIK